MSGTLKVDIGKIRYHRAQGEVFFDSDSRKRVVAKGRRWGFTKGAAQYVIESMIEKVSPVLWGDTIVQNIYNYVERYFLPILNRIPSQYWSWKKQEKKLMIFDSVCDFRSSDYPENWEGFGYKLIILNEAGIILKNQYLWNHAVRPMLMDYPDSIAIIGGTPKGKNLFYELHQKAQTDKNWKSFQFSSYTNPYLTRAEIEELVSELPEPVVRQEIYAEFADVSSHVLIPYELIVECMDLNDMQVQDESQQEIWGLDIARHGDDFSCLSKRYGKYVYSVKTHDIQDTMQLASFVNFEYLKADKKPERVFVETTGMGWGVYDRLRELGVPVSSADVSMKSFEQGILNKRAEMYVRLRDEMRKGLKIFNDKKLLRQLANIEFEFDQKSNIKLTPKEKTKENLGESPDMADSVALTFYEQVSRSVYASDGKKPRYKMWSVPYKETSWMGR